MAKKSKKTYEDSYHGTLKMLFDRDGALAHLSKMRMVQYEMNLWRKCRVPLRFLEAKKKAYFSRRFLKGADILTVGKQELFKAFERLDFAVGIWPVDNMKPTGCNKKCRRLIDKLNIQAQKEGYKSIDDVTKFLDYYTFYASYIEDFDGKPKTDFETGNLIAEFTHQKHLTAFRQELNAELRRGEKKSATEIAEIARKKTEGNKPKTSDKIAKA